jgi:predicted homoserine dehydrogenase-like protein
MAPRIGPTRIGICGTGFIASGLSKLLRSRDDLPVTAMLTRRPIGRKRPVDCEDTLTNSIDDFVERCDLVVECSGDIEHACAVIETAFAAGLPVVTMNTEFQVTAGSHFAGRGRIAEAAGDQPGSLAGLAVEVRSMGFTPLVYGSRKGFLNPTPEPGTMKYWAERQHINLRQVVSFTDGTKVQMEQALVANGLGADIAATGLIGPECGVLDEGAGRLAAEARRLGRPISDYVLQAGGSGEVFIVASHSEEHAAALKYLKLGDGPDYLIVRPFHLAYFEIISTIDRMRAGEPALLDNGRFPRIGVGAIAKRPIRRGEILAQGVGSFDVRGIAVRIADFPDHVPIGLIRDCEALRSIEPGQMLTDDDIAVPETFAGAAWEAILAISRNAYSPSPNNPNWVAVA